MSVISVFAIISVVLLFIGFWVSLITDFDSYIGIIILFCGLILAGITYFAGIHNKEVINTETVEAESTKTETDNAVEELIDSFKGEDSVESQKDSEASEEAEGDNLLITIIAMLVIFSPVLLFMVSELIEDVINFISDLIEICFPKKNKETTTKEFVRETNENSEDNPFIKKIPTPKQKKGINIDKLAEKDSKIAYIVWAVKFLNDQGKESYTRKLKNYYIPEIMQAYEQYQKVKSFHVIWIVMQMYVKTSIREMDILPCRKKYRNLILRKRKKNRLYMQKQLVRIPTSFGQAKNKMQVRILSAHKSTGRFAPIKEGELIDMIV